MDKPPHSIDGRRVCVTGYPSYTQPQDLTRIFSDYGNVKVEKINDKFAVLLFNDEDEAQFAIQDSNEVNIYGEFLTVKKFTGKEEPTTPKRTFPRSKKKDTIVEPRSLDLSGDFHQQLAEVLGAVRLAQREVAALAHLYADLQAALQLAWPGCIATPFGSITTGLGIKTSDADCFINVPANLRQDPVHANYVNKAKRVLRQYPQLFAEILAIPRANTPIVKLFHIPTQTNCDVTFKTVLGALNSKLVAFLLHADARLLPVAVLLKYWARLHGLSGTGRLTNYALCLLLLFYLQQPPVSVLPAVQWLQRDAAAVLVDHWDAGFMYDHERLPKSTNTSSIAELLGGFFQYYSTFNFDEMIVCPFMGMPIKKDLFKDLNLLPKEFERYVRNIRERLVYPLRFTTSMCVQDPFELCHNVASSITCRLAKEIKEYFKFAAATYDKEKLNNCKDFLPTILIQKPKIIHAKLYPEFRVVIYPHIIECITDTDWKSVITEIMKKVFEHICKIKLVKMEEKIHNTGKKQKDRYMAVVNEPIWKRNQFAKLYSLMRLDFLQRQTRITEEILHVEKQMYNLHFKLTLTFSNEQKTAAATIKLTEGDPIVFKEFGKFFASVMQSWFVTLLKTREKRKQEHNEPVKVKNNDADKKPESDEGLSTNVSQTDKSSSKLIEDAEGLDNAETEKANIEEETP